MPLQRKKIDPRPAPVAVTEKAIREERKADSLVIVPPKDAKILQAVAAGDIAENAVMDVFPEMSRPAARAYALNTVKRYNDFLISALERKGVNMDWIADKIVEQGNAMTPLSYRGELTGAEVPDGAARRWAVDTVLDIHPGARAPKETKIEKTSLEAIILRIQTEDPDD